MSPDDGLDGAASEIDALAVIDAGEFTQSLPLYDNTSPLVGVLIVTSPRELIELEVVRYPASFVSSLALIATL
jgi:hypothetical protein